MTVAVNRPWKRWISDLRFTWIAVLLLSVLPGVIYGTGIFSIMVLSGAVLLGLPTALLAQFLSSDIDWSARLWRRVAVLVAVPILALAAIFQTDKLAPEMAAPIAKAIESFKQETGYYPDSLATLSPKYLPSIPAVRVAVFQPEVIYRLSEGRPYLAVPSAAGDAFSIYEYSFEDKSWTHH